MEKATSSLVARRETVWQNKRASQERCSKLPAMKTNRKKTVCLLPQGAFLYGASNWSLDSSTQVKDAFLKYEHKDYANNKRCLLKLS